MPQIFEYLLDIFRYSFGKYGFKANKDEFTENAELTDFTTMRRQGMLNPSLERNNQDPLQPHPSPQLMHQRLHRLPRHTPDYATTLPIGVGSDPNDQHQNPSPRPSPRPGPVHQHHHHSPTPVHSGMNRVRGQQQHRLPRTVVPMDRPRAIMPNRISPDIEHANQVAESVSSGDNTYDEIGTVNTDPITDPTSNASTVTGYLHPQYRGDPMRPRADTMDTEKTLSSGYLYPEKSGEKRPRADTMETENTEETFSSGYLSPARTETSCDRWDTESGSGLTNSNLGQAIMPRQVGVRGPPQTPLTRDNLPLRTNNIGNRGQNQRGRTFFWQRSNAQWRASLKYTKESEQV